MQSHLLADCGASVSQGNSPESFRPAVQTEGDASAGAQIAGIVAENRELKAELDQLRSERARWREMQERVMQLLGTNLPEKLVHDLRNVLNERDLLKALVDEL
jgi:hypothetical protein